MADILSKKTPFDKLFQRAGEQYGVDPNVLKAMAFVESSFNPEAIGPKTKYGRAQGMMQFMPATARAYKLRNPFDPNQAIPAAARYMKDLINQFGGDVSKALEAYNGGPRLVGRSSATKEYAQKVLSKAGMVQEPRNIEKRTTEQVQAPVEQPLQGAQAPVEQPQQVAQGPRTMEQGSRPMDLVRQTLPQYMAALSMYAPDIEQTAEEAAQAEYEAYEGAFGSELASALSDYTPQAFADGGDVRVPSQSEVPQLDESGRVITTPVVPGPPEKEFSPLDYALGAADVGSVLLKGAVVQPYALARALYEQGGSKEGSIQKADVRAQEIMREAGVYPKTEAGGKLLEDVSRMAQEAKIPSIVPQLMGLPGLQRGAVGQGAVLATEEAVLPVMRKITGNKDLTPGQIYSAMGDTGATLRAGAPAATKPGGGDVESYAVVDSMLLNARDELDRRALMAIDPETQISPQTAYDFMYALRRDKPEYIEQAMPGYTERLAFLSGPLKTKLEKYFNTQYGSPNDPLFKAFQEGRYTPASPHISITIGDEAHAKNLADATTLRQTITDATATPEQKTAAKQSLSRIFDQYTPVSVQMSDEAMMNRLKNPIYREEIAKRIHEDLDIPYGKDGSSSVEELLKMGSTDLQAYRDMLQTRTFKGKAYVGDSIVSATKDSVLDDIYRKIEAQGGTPASGLAGQYTFTGQSARVTEGQAAGQPSYYLPTAKAKPFLEEEVADYIADTPIPQLEKMSFPEIVIAAQNSTAYKKITDPEKIAKRIDNYRPVTPEQRFVGTSDPILKVDSDTLKGAQWREVTTDGGLKIEGRLLKHCLSESECYANWLKDETSKYFTLRDKDGKAYISIQMDRFGTNGPYTVVKQVKGFLNNTDGSGRFAKEVNSFLEEYQKTQSRPLTATEYEQYLPPSFAEKVRYGASYAKGGIVDKPLYDRA